MPRASFPEPVADVQAYDANDPATKVKLKPGPQHLADGARAERAAQGAGPHQAKGRGKGKGKGKGKRKGKQQAKGKPGKGKEGKGKKGKWQNGMGTGQ